MSKDNKPSPKSIPLNEEEYHFFVEHSYQGIACFAPKTPIDLDFTPEKKLELIYNGRCIECNTAFAKTHGLTREEAIGKPTSDFLVISETNLNVLKDSFKNKGYIYNMEIVEKDVQGNEKYFLTTVFPEVDHNKITRAWIYQVDITEIKETKKIKHIFESTVHALSTIVAQRDEYTATHQTRVADLSGRIAAELGIDEKQIYWLKIAAALHDLGKIQVPAAILNKSGKFTELEFEVMKTHAEIGYQILKEVDFDFPVAEIVHQHHERIDGSGYPRGLKEDQILPCTKILMVADIVESMALPRPYRKGLGIDGALKFIQEQRGIKLDPAAVDTCLYLFNKKNYQFPA